MEERRVFEKRLRERAKTTFLNVLQTEVMTRLVERLEREGKWDQILDDLVNRRTDPYSLAERLLMKEFPAGTD